MRSNSPRSVMTVKLPPNVWMIRSDAPAGMVVRTPAGISVASTSRLVLINSPTAIFNLAPVLSSALGTWPLAFGHRDFGSGKSSGQVPIAKGQLLFRRDRRLLPFQRRLHRVPRQADALHPHRKLADVGKH